MQEYMTKGKGVSRYFVPDSELTHEDNGIRCAKCTKQFGEIPPSQGCVQKYCSWTNKSEEDNKKNM
jgi:hypothetical protein